MAAVITEQQMNGETFLDLGYLMLVASKSQPGAWYEIRDGRCTCDGFKYRGHCRHLAAVEQSRLEPCHFCGTPTRPSARGSLTVCGQCAMRLTTLDD